VAGFAAAGALAITGARVYGIALAVFTWGSRILPPGSMMLQFWSLPCLVHG